MTEQPQRRFARLRKELYWLHRNKFFAITPLSGFRFINAARNKWEVVLWYVVVIIFGGISAKNIWNVTDQLHQRRTITKMSISKPGGSYYFPNSTLCINAKLPDFSPYYYQRSKSFYKGDLNLTEFKDINLMEEVAKSLAKLPTKESFLKRDWDYILLTLANRYFYFMFASEVVPAIDYINQRPSDDDFHFAPQPFWGTPPAGNATLHFMKYASELNVTSFELADKFKEQLWNFFHFSIIYLSSTEHFTVSRMPTRISWIDNARICFDLSFNDIASRVQLTVNMAYPSQAIKNVVGPNNFELLQDHFIQQRSLSLFLSNDFRPVMASLRAGFPELHVRYRQSKEVIVRVSALYRTIGSCSHKETMHECQGRCRSELIAKLCGCLPFVYTPNSPTKSICTMERYLSCLRFNYTMEKDCIRNCFPHCDKLAYTVDQKLLRTTKTEHWMSLRVSGHHTHFLVFTEEYAQTWEKYIAQLGGIMDFWLGASVIGLIHLFTHLLKQLAYCFSSKTTTGRNIRGLFNGRRDSTSRVPSHDPSFIEREMVSSTSDHENPMLMLEKDGDFGKKVNKSTSISSLCDRLAIVRSESEAHYLGENRMDLIEQRIDILEELFDEISELFV